jgi:hypothetical protein
VVDPTANVIALVVAEGRRQDDLREAHASRQEAEARLRSHYEGLLREAEAKRIDANRAADAAAAAQAWAAAQATAHTLRLQVEATAQAWEARLQSQFVSVHAQLAELQQNRWVQVGGKEQVEERRLSWGVILGVVGAAFAALTVLIGAIGLAVTIIIATR